MACDVECHRQKKLKALQDAYIAASHKAGSDPEGYEQAKIAYFSTRDGPTWLHEYNQQKKEQEQEQQRRKQKQIDDHSPEQPITEDSYEFTRFLQNKQDTSDINQRTFELQGSWFSWDYVELALTIILSLYCVYQLITKLPKFLNYFRGNS
jgi:hypothetical protein